MIAGKCSERPGNDSLQMPSQASVFPLAVPVEININANKLFKGDATSTKFPGKSKIPKHDFVKNCKQYGGKI
jgi:hypothetical protein